MVSVCFQGKPFNITVIQAYAPTNSNAEEAEVERFYEDLQDLLQAPDSLCNSPKGVARGTHQLKGS